LNDDQMNVAERIKALESALVNLRERLDDVTTDLGRTPGNTRLVIQRVNVMKLILQAQTEIDRLRLALSNVSS
jgi:predicted component of type VI protein secretion system